jgi:hypothetical protein
MGRARRSPADNPELFAVTSHRVLLVRPIADPEDLSVRSAGWRAAPFTRGDEYDMNRKLLLSIPTIVLLASTVSFAQEEPPLTATPPSDGFVTEKPMPPDDALRLQPLAGSATTAVMGTAFTYQGQLAQERRAGDRGRVTSSSACSMLRAAGRRSARRRPRAASR